MLIISASNNLCVRCPVEVLQPLSWASIKHSDAAFSQVAGTQYILDSVVAALRDHPDRRFVYGEMVRLSVEEEGHLETVQSLFNSPAACSIRCDARVLALPCRHSSHAGGASRTAECSAS